MIGVVTSLTDVDFDETLRSQKGFMLVDFWAEWCGPCHAQLPILETLASGHPDELAVYKVEVEENRRIAERYAVASVPTLVFFERGEECRRLSGVRRLPQLERELRQLLDRDAPTE